MQEEFQGVDRNVEGGEVVMQYANLGHDLHCPMVVVVVQPVQKRRALQSQNRPIYSRGVGAVGVGGLDVVA